MARTQLIDRLSFSPNQNLQTWDDGLEPNSVMQHDTAQSSPSSQAQHLQRSGDSIKVLFLLLSTILD